MPHTWICPHCQHAAYLRSDDYQKTEVTYKFFQAGSASTHNLRVKVEHCPNPGCRTTSLALEVPMLGRRWLLYPESAARSLPAVVPAGIQSDYREAFRIVDLSPKASATLARRALQGMIRDFWQVKPGRLVDEIKSIQTKVSQGTWDAIDATRKIGNIGAHMEKDISVIVNVDEGEAASLLQLLDYLVDDWYVARDRQQRMLAGIVNASQAKAAAAPAASLGSATKGTRLAPMPVSVHEGSPSESQPPEFQPPAAAA